MTQYAWATDTHLDFLHTEQAVIEFANTLAASSTAGIFLTGDISISNQIVYHLSIIERIAQRPIYFVCGNHDFYRSEISIVRSELHELSNMSPFIKYMPTTSYVALTPSTAVVGHDGWYDALYGDYARSNFMMSDWIAIKDFIATSGGREYVNGGRLKDKNALVGLARKIAHEGVLHVHNGIKAATRYHKNIVVLTHFPPFAQSHIHEGKVGDADAQPWYTSKLMGDMLLDASKSFPNVNFRVLCGHTHGKFDGKITNNLSVHVGGAEYGQPAIAGLIDIA